MREIIELQREMRQRRDAVIKRAPVLMIDIGSSKLSAMVAQFMPSENELAPPSFRILAMRSVRSNGVQYGEIVNLQQTESDLLGLIDALQKQSKIRVDYAVVTSSGGDAMSFALTGEARVMGGEVTNSDIGSAMSSCDFPDLPQTREYLHALPVNFSLDHRSGLHDPRGQVGAQLAVDMHVVTVETVAVQHIRQILKRVDLELIGLSLSAYMSGLCVLTEDEKELGAAIVDMGANTTSIAIFLRKQLLFVRTINLGGEHVSADISKGLDISLSEAERIKTLHGGVVSTQADDRDYISLETASSDRNYISRSELIGIVRPRMEEIFEEVSLALQEAGLYQLPSQRVVLTGGVSQTAGIEELADIYFDRRLRLGRVIHLMGAPTSQQTPPFAALTGLALHAAMPHDELWDFNAHISSRQGLSFRNMLAWFRENW